MHLRSTLVLAALAAGLASRGQAQQTLTLTEALDRADRLAYANRLAAASRRAQAGEGMAAWRGILPSVRVEAGWLRSTDPLNAFGFTLRQRGVTPAAFDPARLNHPAPASHLGSALVLEQPLLNLDAWAGRSAAGHADRAAAASERWTATATRLDVVRAWFGGVLAREKVATLEAALRAAGEHVRQAGALLDQGMVTRSDLLLAQVKAAEIEADLAGARGDQALAARRLALVLGEPGDTSLALPGRLPEPESVEAAVARAGVRAGDPGERDDVQAAGFGAAAARQDLVRSRAAMLPRLNAFARYDWNSPDAVFDGQAAWTVGVMATWAPFSGGSELAAVRAARGRAAMAEAGEEAARAQATLQAAERDNALAVARTRLAIAGRAVAQAEEAHRLVARRYAGGLAPVTDLLGAAAVETASRLGRSAAVYQVIVAAAERQQAHGGTLDFLTALGR